MALKSKPCKAQIQMKIVLSLGEFSSTLLRQWQLILTLCSCDGPNQHAEHCLGNDIGDGVTNLLGTSCECTAQSDHLDDVHAWIGEPRDGGQIASLHNESLGRSRLPLRRFAQANEECIHDIAERNHSQCPPDPSLSIVILDLTRVTKSHHKSRRHTKLPCQISCLISRQSHNQNQLDEQQGHCQEPIHVSVGIIEWSASETHAVLTLSTTVGDLKSGIPRIEDAHIVVGGDGNHQTRDGQCRAVLLLHIRYLQPHKDHA